MSYRIRYNFPIQQKKRYCFVMHTINTALMLDNNPKAQIRLRCIELLEKFGYEAVKVGCPGVSRATVYRWKKQYDESGRKLKGLLPRSTRPKKMRQMVVPAKILGFIRRLRRKYPHLSKYKLKPFLDEFCQEQNLPKYSISWIGKVLSRYELFFSTRKPVRRKRRKPRSGYRIYKSPRVSKLPLGYLQLDGVIVYYNGKRHCFLSCMELKTRQAWAKKVPTISSRHTKLFLKEILKQLPYRVHTIHTDNGSEFHALFEQAVSKLELAKLWSPPRTPKVHSHIERFNRTFQEEFINYHIDLASIEPMTFNKKLQKWLNWYNIKRPHHGIGLKTPHQRMLELLTTTT